MHLVNIASHQTRTAASAGEQPGALPDALEDPRQIVRIEVYAGRSFLPRLAQKIGHFQGPAEIHGVALRQELKLAVRPRKSGRKPRATGPNP